MPIDPIIPLMGRAPAIQNPLDVYQQVLQLQELKSAGEARRASAQEAQAKRQREQQIESAMQAAIRIGPDGQPTIDYATLLPHVPASAIFEVKKHIDATSEQMARLQTANLTVEEKKAAYLGGVARGVRAAGDDPDAFRLAVVGAKKVGALAADQADQLLDLADSNPAAITRWTTSAIAQASTADPEAGFTLGPGQVRYGPGGTQIAAGPPRDTATDSFTLSPGSVRFGPNGQQIASVPASAGGLGAGFTLSPGQTRYGPGGEVLATRPGAPGGTGGRNVTAGDARMQADYNTSRDDLAVLSEAITSTGATGAIAAAGASLPKWVTDFTGWGTDAKKKQALIDRVKQVIGKTLEGGVLRKEDEVKYERILPTIGDAPAIVISKLQGIDAAIQQRQSTHLEALADAGYDVSRFQARPPRAPIAPPGTPTTPGGSQFTVKAPNGTTYSFNSAAELAAFKRRAGIP